MRTWFLAFFLLFLLAACASQPTALLPTATSTLIPTHTPTLTPSPTLTPTPTPLPHPAAFDEAFARRLIRYDAASGQWLVSAVQSVDGGRQTIELVLLPDSFDTHDDLRLKNPLAPYTVRAISPLPAGEGPGVREVTLLWDAEKAEFRLAYTFPPLFEGVGTENPRLLEENLAAIPFIPIEDIQSGLAAQSVLLAMSESGYQPFSENTRLGENRLHFELRNNGLRVADLISLENFNRNLNVNNHPMKVTPFFFRTQLPNGQEVMTSWIAILNPTNHENWSPDEFIVVPGILPFGNIQEPISNQDLANFFRAKNPFYVVNRVFLYATNPNLDPNDPNTIVIPNPSNTDNPTLLDARDPFQSLLSQLLSIEGNDIRLADDYENLFERTINRRISQLTPQNNIIEIPLTGNDYHFRLPNKSQTVITLVEVGVAQSNP